MSLLTKLQIVAACPHCTKPLLPAKKAEGLVCKACDGPIKRVFNAQRMAASMALVFVSLAVVAVVIGLFTSKFSLSIAQLIGVSIGAGLFGGFHHIKDPDRA